jgi:hypothetical protein
MADSDLKIHERLLFQLRTSNGQVGDLTSATVTAFEHIFQHIERLERRIAELEARGETSLPPQEPPPVKPGSPPPYR